MKLFALLIGLILVLEGLPYVAAPEAMQKWLKIMSNCRPARLRSMGLIAMVVGLFICFLVQRLAIFG